MWSEARFESVSLRERRYDLALSFLPNANTFTFLYFCNALRSRSIEPSLRLGDKGGQKYASPFSSPGFTYQQERLTLIPGGDQCRFTPDISRQLPVQDGLFSCKLVLLSSIGPKVHHHSFDDN